MPKGWVNLLLDRHVRKVDILSRGYSGYNTRWILEHINELEVDFKRAQLVTILMGANDSQGWKFSEFLKAFRGLNRRSMV